MTHIVERLEPCPFCGSEAQAIEKLNSVACSNPHCRAAIRWVASEPIEHAIAAWNRTPTVATDEGVVERMREALKPFAALARPKTWDDAPGETGPSQLDIIEGEGGTGELYLGTHFGTSKYITLWRDDFARALAAIAAIPMEGVK